MRAIIAVVAMLLLAGPARAAVTTECDVPGYLLFSEYALDKVLTAVRKEKRLNVLVVGSASSLLAGPSGASDSYPAKTEELLRRKLPDVAVRVTVSAQPRRTAAEMATQFPQLLASSKPDLVVWQTGTVDAMRGIEPQSFQEQLESGIDTLRQAGADVILMNMQFSPRTESLIASGAYADNMRWVTQERAVPLFDRFGIMRYWSDTGVFDFSGSTRDPALARQVHECVGRALASLTIEAGKLLKADTPTGQ